MSRVFAFFAAGFLAFSFAAGCPAAQAEPAMAAANSGAFLQSVRGAWSGKGQVVAGRYKGIKFSCNFTAPDAADSDNVRFNGSCRTGIFSQPIKASITRRGDTYQGQFNKGAQADGMDITAGQINDRSMVLQLNRDKLKGSMTARLSGENQLRITLAVQIDDESIPVIGMDLTRAAPSATVAAKGQSMFAWLTN